MAKATRTDFPPQCPERACSQGATRAPARLWLDADPRPDGGGIRVFGDRLVGRGEVLGQRHEWILIPELRPDVDEDQARRRGDRNGENDPEETEEGTAGEQGEDDDRGM